MRRSTAAWVGLLSGGIAALWMIFAMLALRALWGIATPPELIGDRVAPLLNVWLFIALLTAARGYNRLKQLGVSSVLAGQIVVGAAAGLVYALLLQSDLVQDPRRGAGRRADRFLAIFVAIAWLVSVLLLWPNLGTNYHGLPPGEAALATSLGLLVGYAIYALSLRALCRLLLGQSTVQPTPASAAGHKARRALLVLAAGTAAGIGAAALLRDFYRKAVYNYDGTQYRGPDIEPFTPNARFYVVTKNNVDPAPVRELWRLEIAGRVQRARTYRFADLIALPAVTQETTLECISNWVGGGLISNAMWKGVPLRHFIEEAGPLPGIQEVVCRAVDGYADNISYEQAMDPTTLIAYEMNGVPLPAHHGFPARLIVPGLVGEKSIKWLTRIDLVDRTTKQFYERQGWGPNFIIHTTSRFDAPDVGRPLPLDVIALKGIAFAGSRGVDQVEVSTDGGRTWQRARLTYRGSRLGWALWSYSWTPLRAGEYALVVRATDGLGAVQTAQDRVTVPEGASGYHRLVARVE
jgi:DMSO/TMAO reductase YedYZ molybdopterin-dependent catalytic subunit